MIYDTLKNLSNYRGIHPGVLRGLELLRETDFSKLEDGHHDIDGDDLFILLQSYDSKPVNDRPEAHRAYLDIQYLIFGVEDIGIAPLGDMTREVEAKPENDIWFYQGPVSSRIRLGGGTFAVLWPEDAHAPCIAVDQPVPCRKCVVKVKL